METNTAEQESNSVLTKEELDAALAEIEELVPGEDGMPSLDDGQDNAVVHVPVPGPAMAARIPNAPAEPPPPAAKPAPQPTPASADPAEETSEPPPAAANAPKDVAGRPSLVYRLLDVGLQRINQPFGWLKPSIRRIIGIVALATIATSLLAGLCLPRLVARHDAAAVLRAKRAELLVAPPQPAEDSPSADG